MMHESLSKKEYMANFESLRVCKKELAECKVAFPEAATQAFAYMFIVLQSPLFLVLLLFFADVFFYSI